MLKIDHVKKITKESIEARKRKEEATNKKQEEKELKNLYKDIESDIMAAATQGKTSCTIRMESDKYFEVIKEKYPDFSPVLIHDDDGEPFFTFTWE